MGEFYHLYNRGNSKQDIFLNDKDRDRFVKMLYLCNSTKNIKFKEHIVDRKIDAWDFDTEEPIVSIGAWVLMPNHFHIYITPYPKEGLEETLKEKAIPLFMSKLCTAYSMYFNKKYQRTGKLFEGAFKSVRVRSDQQAKYVFSYIHLNPVKLIDPQWKERGLKNIGKTLDFLNGYYWSSYHDHRNKNRLENQILSLSQFPECFGTPDIFDKEIFEWLHYNDDFPKASP